MIETLHCTHCHTTMTCCSGCGRSLAGRYRRDTKQCVNCGTKLIHCMICGNLLVPSTTFPISDIPDIRADRVKSARRNYCPACGDPIGTATAHCPHCGIDIELYMDHIYESTYDHVNRIVLEEEANQPLDDSNNLKKKNGTTGEIYRTRQIPVFYRSMVKLGLFMARYFGEKEE